MAEGQALELTWTAPSTCPTETEIETAVLKNAATQSSEAKGRPPLFARGVVTERTEHGAKSAFHVLLQTERGGVRGEREITAESCAALAEATAVVLSLALLDLAEDTSVAPAPVSSPGSDTPDPGATSRDAPDSATARARAGESRTIATPEERQNSSGTSQNQAKAQPPSEEALRQDKKKPKQQSSPKRQSSPKQQSSPKIHRSLAHFALLARGGLNTGTLPRLTLGGALGASWVPGAFRFELGAQMWRQQSEVVNDTPAGAELSLRSFGARACLKALDSKRLSLSPCIGPEFHLLRAKGFGSDSNYNTTASWPALAWGLLGVAPLSSLLALRAEVEGRVALARPRLLVERLGTVHEIPPLSFTTLFGAEVYFP
jgi:hypothetical protein